MIKELKELKIELMVSIWPTVGAYLFMHYVLLPDTN